MKSNNQYIKVIAKKLFHHKPGMARATLIHPERDWVIGVVIGLLIIVLMIGWSTFTYLQNREVIELDETGVEADIPEYKAEVIENALDLFAKRHEVFISLSQPNAAVSAPAVEVVTAVATTTVSSTTSEKEEETLGVEAEAVIEEDLDQDIEPPATFSSQVQPVPPDLLLDDQAPEAAETPTLVE